MHPCHDEEIVKSFQFLEELLGVRPDHNVVLSIIDYLFDVAVQYAFRVGVDQGLVVICSYHIHEDPIDIYNQVAPLELGYEKLSLLFHRDFYWV
jgi:hypothetical protein